MSELTASNQERIPRAVRIVACCWVGAALICVAGCRGNKSSEPPIHLQQNMDFQKKFEAQEQNTFYKDGRAMRPPVPHTVARGELRKDDLMFRGTQEGKKATKTPMPITAKLLKRGQARYNIYCAICHGGLGDGQSVLRQRKIAVAPTSYHEDRLLKEPIGHFYDVISNGIRNMQGYAAQIPVHDRWAIAAYVRALQIAGNASLAQVPPNVRVQKGWRN